MRHAVLLASLCLLCLPTIASAHPVPKKFHDRIAVVRLTPDAVIVEYRLEIDEWTVVFEDVPALLDKEQLAALKSPRQWYDAFTREYAPILAGNLIGTLDGQPLEFQCIKHSYEVIDSLRCDFVFRAPWKLLPNEPHKFALRDSNYELELGRLNLSFAKDNSLEIIAKSEADEVLRAKPLVDLQPGDEPRLRKVSATFRATAEQVRNPGDSAIIPPKTGESAEAKPARPTARNSLLDLLDTNPGFWMLMWLSLFFGAVHALTPGHGKTLVAAYLVGERGTTFHALVLGLVTTLTHTGAVLILAAVLGYFFPKADAGQLQVVLGFGGGLLVAFLGFWLLLRRLSNRPDHVHFAGHGHHHHGDGHNHDHAGDHFHDEHGHTHPLPEGEATGTWWQLIVLGISGGIVPCTDAIFLFLFLVSTQRIWLALPALLAFSAGLAGVLVAIGIMVVRLKSFAGSRFGDNRLFRALPLISAITVTCLGLWLCYDSIHTVHTP